jgi:hypothetical protein
MQAEADGWKQTCAENYCQDPLLQYNAGRNILTEKLLKTYTVSYTVNLEMKKPTD